MRLQLAISHGFIYLCLDTVLAHWIYLAVALVVLIAVYVLFMKKCCHLHEDYIKALTKRRLRRLFWMISPLWRGLAPFEDEL